MMEEPKSQPIYRLGNLPTIQMRKNVRQIIRKKASLYGLSELSNPLMYDRNSSNLIFSQIRSNRNHIRSVSTFQSVSSNKKNPKNTQDKNQPETQEQAIPVVPSYKVDPKTNKQLLFPKLNKLVDLVKDQKVILHVFRDKLDYDLNDIVFQFLKILELTIAHQAKTFKDKIDLEKSILLETLEFLAQSFLECGFDKLAIILGNIGVQVCEFYKKLNTIAKFLFIVAKVLRKMFKYDESVKTLSKALQYAWYGRKLCLTEQKEKQKQTQKDERKQGKKQPQIKTINNNQNSQKQQKNQQKQQSVQYLDFINTELEIYNELSYCLLQVNRKEDSKMFGEKYEIGFFQKQYNSSILTLSRDLINSAQKRSISWQRIDDGKLDLLFGIKLQPYLQKNQQNIKNKFQQAKFLKALKINLQSVIDNFFKKQIFFYEIPFNTDMKNKQVQEYKKNHTSKLPLLTAKFVNKKRSTGNSNSMTQRSQNVKRKKNQEIGENKIFNYRGIGLSRSKLTNSFRRYIRFIQIMFDFHPQVDRQSIPSRQVRQQLQRPENKNKKRQKSAIQYIPGQKTLIRSQSRMDKSVKSKTTKPRQVSSNIRNKQSKIQSKA